MCSGSTPLLFNGPSQAKPSGQSGAGVSRFPASLLRLGRALRAWISPSVGQGAIPLVSCWAEPVSLRRLESALALLGSLDPGGLPLHHARVLVWLAQRDEATYQDIEAATGLSNAAVSRTLNSLAEESPHRKRTLGLIEIYRDPMSGRRYKVRLNRRGREFMRALEGLLDQDPGEARAKLAASTGKGP